MKKRIFSLLMVLVMIMSLVACSKKPVDNPNQGGDDLGIEVAKSTPTPAPAKEEVKNDNNDTPAVDEPAAPAEYVREDDEEVYERALGGFTALSNAAKAAKTIDERFMLFAQAEAYLLDSAVMIPTTTQNGASYVSSATES